jgi:hypothetical protein
MGSSCYRLNFRRFLDKEPQASLQVVKGEQGL